jgi:hypothetical protein
MQCVVQLFIGLCMLCVSVSMMLFEYSRDRYGDRLFRSKFIAMSCAFAYSLLFILGVSVAASAIVPQRLNIDAFLEQSDADNDGVLNLDEIQKAAVARFDTRDRGRGGISKTEYLALVEQLFHAADKDRGRTLDKKELDSLAGRNLLWLVMPRQGRLM